MGRGAFRNQIRASSTVRALAGRTTGSAWAFARRLLFAACAEAVIVGAWAWADRTTSGVIALAAVTTMACLIAWKSTKLQGHARVTSVWITAAIVLLAIYWVATATPPSSEPTLLPNAFGIASYLCIFGAVWSFLVGRSTEIRTDAVLDVVIAGLTLTCAYFSAIHFASMRAHVDIEMTTVSGAYSVIILLVPAVAVLAVCSSTSAPRAGRLFAVTCAAMPVVDLVALLRTSGAWPDAPDQPLVIAAMLLVTMAIFDDEFTEIFQRPTPDRIGWVPPVRLFVLAAAVITGPAITLFEVAFDYPVQLWRVAVFVLGIGPLVIIRLFLTIKVQAMTSERVQLMRAIDADVHAAETNRDVAQLMQRRLRRVDPLLRVRLVEDDDGTVRLAIKPGLKRVSTFAAELFGDAGRIGDRACATILERNAKANQQVEQRFASLASHSADILSAVSPTGKVTFITPAVTRILGHEVAEVIGKDLRDLAIDADVHHVDRLLHDVKARHLGVAEIRMPLRDGGVEWMEITGAPCADGELGAYVLSGRSITDRKAIEATLEFRATHDDLTGLGNRHMLLERLESDLRQPEFSQSTAMFFIDLDNFKDINDTLGHSVGDRVLKVIAQRLISWVHDGDLPVRLGGDEFAVVTRNVVTAEDAEEMGARLIAALGGTIRIDGHVIPSSVSIGVALAGGTAGIDGQTLLRRADIAMYQAKSDGRHRVARFDASQEDAAARRLLAREGLVRAIEHNELVLWFQPVYSLTTKQVVGAEALVRWNHPERGLLGPGQFVPMVEASQLGDRLGEWVLDSTCRHLHQWLMLVPEMASEFSLAVNVSPHQLESSSFADNVVRRINSHGVDPSMITIEITERALIADGLHANRQFDALRSHGIKVAIDDFGTGHSSLGTIHRIQFDVLKIDRSFVVDLVSETSDSRPVVRAILDLARQLGVRKVIAEGVESLEQVEVLAAMGCGFAQGYVLGRPMPEEQFIEVLTREHAALSTPRPPTV